MKPQFPAGPATRSALYGLGLLATLKALSLVLMAQAIAAMLAGLMSADPAWGEQLGWGMAGVVLRSAAVWAQGTVSRRAALGVKEKLRSQLVARALRDGVRTASPSDGGLAVLATRGLDALDSYYTQFLPALVNCAAIPLLLGARILFADWLSAVVIVLTLPLVPVFMVLIGRYTEDRVRDAQSALWRLSGHMLELAKGLPVLVGLGRATAQRRALEDISEEYRSKTMETLRTAFLSALALELIATISVAVVAVFIGVRLVHGQMPLEAGLLALLLAPDCYLPLRELGTAHHASDDGRAALAEATAVLESPEPEVMAVNDDGGHRGGAASTGITVTSLTVTYSGRGTAAVGPLSFRAPAGKITALAGPSGAGKSTVLGVLAGTVCRGQGSTVSGELAGFNRKDVAWVPQHPVMASDTVLGEVELFGATDEDAARACLTSAAAAHLAAKHPAELSPGELRRVALARALARIDAGATVLLLDEPTAHLDASSAEAIRRATLALRGRVTVIMVAHEAGTRAIADHVVQVEGAAYPMASADTAHSPAADRYPAQETAEVRNPNNPPQYARAPQLLRRLLSPAATGFSAAAAAGTLAALFAVALTGLSGWLIIRASEQPPILYLLTAIVGVRFFGIGRAALRYSERLLVHNAVFSLLTHLRGRLWASLSQRALSLRRLLRGGSVLGTVIDDVDTVRELLPRVVLPAVTSVMVGAAAVATTALLLPAALPVVLASALVSLIVAPLVAVWADRASAASEQWLRGVVLRNIASALGARAELKVNGVASRVLASIEIQDRAATAASQRSAWAEGLGQAIVVAACGAATLGAAVLAAPEVLGGSTAGATAAVVILLQLALVETYSALTTAVRQFPALRAVLRRLEESGALEHVAPADQEVSPVGILPVPERAGAERGIELTGLAAQWPGGAQVFAGITVSAQPGRWLAVTGPSGSGKSTLLAVLMGFLPARSGAVAVTGTLAWCPQQAYLFDSTVRGNLLLGRRPGSGEAGVEEAMQDALAAVGLSQLLGRLPEGLDTRIGPGGAFLSGGERQRLAVARTLMAGAEVILLDEPTAHLDAESARAMLADLRVGLADRTVVLVTHNPADIDSGDTLLSTVAPGGSGF